MAIQRIFALTALTILVGTAPSVSGHEVDLSQLPLGDGRISSGPQAGSIFACQSRFNPNAPGAHATGPWLGASTFDLEAKPTVGGEVFHRSELSIAVEGSSRRIVGNGLPDHATGVFPIRRTDEAYQYDRNPGTIESYSLDVTLPRTPEVAAEASCLPMGAIGVMLSGAVLFNALDARGDDALAHEILDSCQGHPQREGVYHYHGKSPCVDDPAADELDHSGLVGYALDGFGIFGWRGEDGDVLSNADLDACHGHVGEVEWDGELVEIYHYHATPEYPYTLSCFRGTPLETRIGAPGGGARRGPRRGPPRGRGFGE
ncbi:MAG: YHYH protein, partial [Acidobacteriota bacterium]